MPLLPAHLQDVIRINWHVSSWCNYSCEYCPVVVFRQRSKTGQAQPHAFDYQPVAEWLRIIQQLALNETHLNISGGEPFLDRTNFHALLAGLLALPQIRVAVATNGYWDPAFYKDIDKSRISVMIAYHPREIAFEKFLDNLRRIRDAAFKISMVNFVLAPENMDHFDAAFEALEAEGFFVNVSSMMSAGRYWARTERTERELDLIERYNTPSDNYFKLVKPETKGQLCFYPAMTYYLMYDGLIQVACQDGTIRNVFKDGIPPIPREAVACEYDRCVGCSDMYRGLVDHPMVRSPLQFFGTEDYVEEVRRYRRHSQLTGEPASPSIRAIVAEVAARQASNLVSIDNPARSVAGATSLRF